MNRFGAAACGWLLPALAACAGPTTGGHPPAAPGAARSFNVRDFGAAGDGVALDTRAIQRAVDAAARAAGRVVLPPGRYRSGTVDLRGGVTLDLAPGAVLVGSDTLEDYRFTGGWGWPQDERVCDISPFHLLQAFDAEGIAITGGGTIDGSGAAFWDPPETPWHFWTHRANRRPSPMLHFVRCRDLRIEGIRLKDSAGWNLHCHDCERVSVVGLTVRNTQTFFGPNSDGMDISNCRGVVIRDCDIETGDDAIAVMASRYGGPSEDVRISDCRLATSCVALRIIGFDAEARHRRIVAANLTVPRCSRVVDIRSLGGARIEQVAIANVVGNTNSGWPINRPIEVVAVGRAPDAPRPGGDPGALPVGLVRDVSLRDIDIRTDGRCFFAAKPPHAVSDVRIRGLSLRYVLLDDPGPVAAGDDKSLFLPGLPEARAAKAALVVENVERLSVLDLSVRWPSYPIDPSWFLLKSPHRLLNASIYAGKEEAIRKGEIRPLFKVLWARDLRDARIDLHGLTDSEGGTPATGWPPHEGRAGERP